MSPYFSLNNYALALSKLAQVLLPLGVFLLIRIAASRTDFASAFVDRVWGHLEPDQRTARSKRIERRFERLGGFVSWKVGCDLGYFLIAGQNPWQAFTLAGLIPYTVVQYLVYRLFCQKIVLSGMTNPLADEHYRMPRLRRRGGWRRLVAKFFHEDCNATSPNVPLRRVVLKPFADYLAVVLSWSAFTMGLFFLQSGEINWHPVTGFSYAFMAGYYLGGILAFIWGYNLGEYFLRKLVVQWSGEPERFPIWRRSLALRLRVWRERYSFSPVRFGAAIAGVLMVIFVTVPVQAAFVSLADAVQCWHFDHWGKLDPGRVQMLGSPVGNEPPDFASAVAKFRATLSSSPPSQP